MTQTMSLLDAVRQLEPVIRTHAPEAESQRSLSLAAHEAMLDAGLFRMFVPRSLGGLEADIVTGFEVLEEVSRIDSAAGWNLQIATAPTAIAALFPDATVREVFANPRNVTAGGFFPPGMLQPAGGGFQLRGRWSFVSGCQRADWMINPALELKDGAPIMLENGQPLIRICLYPAAEAEVIETWNPLGMRGTGSHDVVANDVFIPLEHTAVLHPFAMEPNPSFDIPLTRLGIMPTICGNAVVALGIARAAIDESLEIIAKKTPAHFQAPPAQRSTVQGHLGRAEATLSAARAYFFDSLGNAWAVAKSGSSIGPEERKHLQLAASFAAESAAKAVDYVHASVGSSGVLESNYAFARHFRDVHTITQHALCSGARFESIGQVMLGLETDWAYFYV